MNKGIIIIWPKYNHFKNTIISELQINNYEIIKEHSFNVNKNYIKNFLSEIHYGKEWWSKNLIPEVEKRLNADTIQNLDYLIVEKSDIYLIFKKFKKDLREKYKIDKSYFHLCDPDCYKHLGLNCNCATDPNEFKKEFNNHIHMLTNKNSIHFLTNSTYNTEYKFYKFFDIYVNILKNNNLDINNFCVDNGGILAAYGIRDTHDLDYLTTTNILINNQYISCENKNHKVEYEKLGYNINDLINNDDNYFYHFGIKFMSLEILKKFKYNRTHTIGTGHKEIRKKDICDYNLINKLL
jgi:hypothetical protein